ncbi:ShlB/FhaC/HecB family hemolysin secretion/activation protein [Nodularia sp. UHCC 0506]|uniref:ShlB/FhaC/HecB family hemolysin secretion/activation protein n=1 Tax=Nodularia sp. UHCC 0506 TaxID=3110243 RepID=UPI002B21272B|nr:ShlB/FhaC/HecB family hemolysin secretion/activation protein [Nodularia sp. UHCC 0506]MEA5515389.1 ShlB/FhaC/HecB family hemolysin secretion/activation protein [Nodularia sp. UHCC 0506]
MQNSINNRFFILFSHYVVLSFVFFLTLPTLAQAPNPGGERNLDRFPQPGTIPEPLPSLDEPFLQPTPTPEVLPTEPSESIRVEKILVTGSTIFTSETLNPIINSVEGRSVTLAELREVADAITQLYLDNNYITSRAILVDQKIINGVVEIRVIEGSIEKIEIQGTERLNPEYVRSRVALGVGQPLSTNKLEDQLRLVQTDPLLTNLEASLRPGSGIGKSILILRTKEANAFNAVFSVDNYSPPSIGSERLGISATYRNLTGIGDEIAASYYRTVQGGSNIYDLNYRVPLNAMNGSLQLRTSINNNQIIQGSDAVRSLDISGESQLYEISYRQPLVRSLREEFALSLGFTIQNGQTFTFAGATPFGLGPDADGNSRTRVIKFGQDYVRRDVQGAWALRSLFSLGIGVFDATVNDNPIPDGRFFSWFGQIQRVQRLNLDNLLIAQAEIQLTPNALLPSQQFVVGGGQSVRGYRQNARAADNGVRFFVENRITVQRDAAGDSTLQIAPFFDLAYVWNTDDNPNLLQRQNFLAGLGMGILYQPLKNLDIRLDYALPLINLDDRGTNAQDDGFHFSVSYRL